MEDINQIDLFKSLFPPEDQKRLTFPAEIRHDAPPVSVDWQVLQKATHHAWNWMLHELGVVAQNEGYRDFLKTRANQVRSYMIDGP
jgi:hypothetical protein